MKSVTRTLFVGLIVMASIAIGEKAIANNTVPQLCCGDPHPCPGLPICPVGQ